DPMNPKNPPVRFSVAEGEALEVLGALLGRGRGDAVRRPVPLDPLRFELANAGARRIAKTVVRYLTEADGYHERMFVRDGARLVGPNVGFVDDDLRVRLPALVAADSVRVVECAETRLVRAWSNEAANAWRSREPIDTLTDRWNALARTLSIWLDVLDAARRLD